MITFKPEMDQRSLTIERDGKRLGFLQWHKGREPRVTLWPGEGQHAELTIGELRSIIIRYDALQMQEAARLLAEQVQQINRVAVTDAISRVRLAETLANLRQGVEADANKALAGRDQEKMELVSARLARMILDLTPDAPLVHIIAEGFKSVCGLGSADTWPEGHSYVSAAKRAEATCPGCLSGGEVQ